MRVRSLEVENFRNYARLELEFRDGRNLLIGANAQGKTNILEAIYLCSCARSHRTGKDRELIRQGESFYRVRLTFQKEGQSEETIEIRYQDENKASFLKSKRDIFYQNNKLEKISELFGLFHAVIFAPEDVHLVKEGPAARRRFLDLLISQIRPGYFSDLQIYQHILGQRNRLLKQARERNMRLSDLKDLIAAFDEQLSFVAARIMKERECVTQKIESTAQTALRTISEGTEQLSLRYHGMSHISLNESVPNIQEALFHRFIHYLEEDYAKGITQHGPHRDDLELSLNGVLIRPFASQGQQRSVVLALKIAELKLLEQETGTSPVLLLDDVMSELDAQRRENLSEALRGHQVILTGTDADRMTLTESQVQTNSLKQLESFAKPFDSGSSQEEEQTKYFYVSSAQVFDTPVK